eukprot:6192937-Pleurochrysis_carterae.AAC.3
MDMHMGYPTQRTMLSDICIYAKWADSICRIPDIQQYMVGFAWIIRFPDCIHNHIRYVCVDIPYTFPAPNVSRLQPPTRPYLLLSMYVTRPLSLRAGRGGHPHIGIYIGPGPGWSLVGARCVGWRLRSYVVAITAMTPDAMVIARKPPLSAFSEDFSSKLIALLTI